MQLGATTLGKKVARMNTLQSTEKYGRAVSTSPDPPLHPLNSTSSYPSSTPDATPSTSPLVPQTLTPPAAFPEEFKYLVCTSNWLGGRPAAVNAIASISTSTVEEDGNEGGSQFVDLGIDIVESDGHGSSLVENGRGTRGNGPDDIEDGPPRDRSMLNSARPSTSQDEAGGFECHLGTMARRAGMRLRIRHPTTVMGDDPRKHDGRVAGDGLDAGRWGTARGDRSDTRSNDASRKDTQTIMTTGSDAFDQISIASSHSSSPNSPTQPLHPESTITLPLLNLLSLSLTIRLLRSRPDISLAFLLGLTGLTWLWNLVGTIWWQVVAGGAVCLAAGLRVGVELARRRGWLDLENGDLERDRERVRARRERREKRRAERVRRARDEIVVPKMLQVGPATANASNEEREDRGTQIVEQPPSSTNEDAIQPPSASDMSLQSLALDALRTVIRESDGLDEAVGRALALLGDSEGDSPLPHETEHIPHRALRQRLDQALTSVVSQLARSSDTLLPLISHEEFATFSEMYSIDDGRETDSRRTSSNTTRSYSMMDTSDAASKRLSGVSLGVFSDFSEEAGEDGARLASGCGETYTPQAHGDVRQGLATAKGRRRANLTEDPSASPAKLRSSQSTPYLRLGSPITATQDRFTAFPMRSPRPASRQSWTTSLDKSLCSSEEEGKRVASPRFPFQRQLGHLRTESEALAGIAPGYRYGAQPDPVREDVQEDRYLVDPASHEPRPRPVSMHIPRVSRDTGSVPYPRPRSSQDIREAVHGHVDLDPAFAPAPPPRPTHGLRQLRLSQSSITGVNGLPLAPHIPPSPSDHSPLFSDHGLDASPARPDPNPDKTRYRASWQEGKSRRPLSFHGASPGSRRRIRTHGDAGDLFGDNDRPASTQGLGLGAAEVTLQRSNSNPIRRPGHSRNPSTSRRSDAYPSSTVPPSLVPFPQSHETFSLPNQYLQTPARPRATRTSSLGPLTLSALKGAFLGMHLKRRKAACCLLALRFEQSDARFIRGDGGSVGTDGPALDPVELAKYWAAVHGALDELYKCILGAKDGVVSEISQVDRAVGNSSLGGGHLGQFSGDHFLAAPISHAPRYPDSQILLSRANAMSSALRKMQMQLGCFDAESSDPRELYARWDAIRDDLGGIIRDWEQGRMSITKMIEAQGTLERTAGGTDHHDAAEHRSPGLDSYLPDHIRSWSRETNEGDGTEDAFVHPGQEIERDQVDTDDASNHLIQATSPAFLPPPGIERVFEGLSARGTMRVTDGPKLSREDRIKATKAARSNGKAPLQSSSAQETVPGPPQRTDRDVRARSGEMVSELKGVIGELRRRKEGDSDGGGNKI